MKPRPKLPRHFVSLRRQGHDTLKPRSAVTETGPQPGMSDITHTTANPPLTPACPIRTTIPAVRTRCVH